MLISYSLLSRLHTDFEKRELEKEKVIWEHGE